MRKSSSIWRFSSAPQMESTSCRDGLHAPSIASSHGYWGATSQIKARTPSTCLILSNHETSSLKRLTINYATYKKKRPPSLESAFQILFFLCSYRRPDLYPTIRFGPHRVGESGVIKIGAFNTKHTYLLTWAPD